MAESRNPGKTVEPEEFCRVFAAVNKELARVVIGQERAIEHLLVAVFGGGHALLTGMPGLGRTLLVKSMSIALGLEHRRIQFTPDLLPTDIVGAEVLEKNQSGERRFHFFKGPVFANMVLADEINRSPARTQSALLELMQERQITVGGNTYHLPKPFVLIATQNTVDSEGVWPLGEAQADRFMLCIEQFYPGQEAEGRMLDLTTGMTHTETQKVTDPETVVAMQKLAREVPVVPSVKQFALAIVRASRPGSTENPESSDIRLGASPRAAQALLLGAKVLALAHGRRHVTQADVAEIAPSVMTHRLMIDFKAQAAGRDARYIVGRILKHARERAVPQVSMWTKELLKPIGL
jgi:MoxR-like ATPase